MNGLRKQRVSKTSGSLIDNAVLLIIVLVAVVASGLVPTSAQQSVTAERINANVVLFTYEGKQYMGFDLEASKVLKQAENDAKAFKAQLELCHDNLQKAKDNTQDERVRASNIKRDYGDQSKLLTSCMALSGNGPKWSKNWLLRLGLDVAPTVTNFVRKCD